MNLTKEFQLQPGLCYLNHAAVAPWPSRCEKAIRNFAKENVQRGASNYRQWLNAEATLRKQFQALLNAPSPSDIALVKNTSEGISMIAYGLDWKPGDSVVISDEEFPSNRIVWESLRSKGVLVKEVNLHSADPELSVISACDQRTRIISLSSVQYASGFRIDLERIGQFCKQSGLLFCVDAIQSLGAHSLDVQKCNVDFVVADGHKWLLGPEGLGVFFSTAKARRHLSVYEYGWHMVEHAGDYDKKEWTIAESARRFECGSPNMLAIHALSASLSLLLDVSIETVEKELSKKVDYLLDKLDQHPNVEVISAKDLKRRAGIVTFRHATLSSTDLHQQLLEKQIICANRGGGIRYSPHFYTPQEVLDQAVSAIP